MGFNLRNKKEIQKYITGYSKVVEKALIRELQIIVAKLENHAKDNAWYEDDTGNLKSSIGGLVLKDGIPIGSAGFEGKTEGINSGKTFINSLIDNIGSGYVILVVAGMEYAAYVEEYHNLNVLAKTNLQMPKEMNAMFEKLSRKLSK